MTFDFWMQCLLVDVPRNAGIPVSLLRWDCLHLNRQYYRRWKINGLNFLASHWIGITSEYPNLIRWTAAWRGLGSTGSIHTVPRLWKNVVPGMQAAETRVPANPLILTGWYSCRRARPEVEEVEQSSGVQRSQIYWRHCCQIPGISMGVQECHIGAISTFIFSANLHNKNP